MSKSFAPFVRSPYNYDVMAASDESGLNCLDPSRTSQQFLQESDINWIIENFTRTGELPNGQVQPQFGDFTDLPSDYHTALNQVRNADMAFMTLPANIRSEFDNDAGKLLAFMNDPKNRDRAIELGLVTPKEDLSTASRAALNSEAPLAVGKSVPQAKASVKAVAGAAEGGQGDE